MNLELMAEQARIRLHQRINRSAGQHKRAIGLLCFRVAAIVFRLSVKLPNGAHVVA